MVVVARVEVPVARNVPTTVKRLAGVEVPIPTLLLLRVMVFAVELPALKPKIPVPPQLSPVVRSSYLGAILTSTLPIKPGPEPVLV
jgi:hypothetical protein